MSLLRLDGQRSMSLLMVAQETPSYDRCAKKSASTKTIKHIKKLSIFLKYQRKTFCKLEQWIERPFAHFVHSRIAKLECTK